MGRSPGRTRELVLVGGGHAHALVLQELAARPLPCTRITLVNEGPRAIYSGMVPGFVAGQYQAEQVTIDLERLAARAGARLVSARVTRVSASARAIEMGGGTLLPYDVASLDVGSTVSGLDVPGVRRFALATRPVAALVRAVPALIECARDATTEFRAIVVGGGAGGVELACALHARLRREGVRHAHVSLLEASSRLLPGRAARIAATVARRCTKLGIEVETHVRVVAVEDGQIELEGGERRPFDALLWCTGAAAHAWPRESGLPVDEHGYVRVRSTLQAVGHDDLFAVGDAASIAGHAGTPKAGVYAVRAAPVLAHNLRAVLTSASLRAFEPQRDYLTLLNLGHGRALGFKWGYSLEGRTVFWLKDWIDRRFVARFRAGTRDREPVPAHP